MPRFLNVYCWYIVFFLILSACGSNSPGEQTKKKQAKKWYTSNRMPLVQTSLIKLPIGSIQAEGWLKNQLTLQISGLTGKLDEIWEEVGPNSGWLGGTGESWERGPYYLRGAIALAYTTRDSLMLNKIKPWIEWTLASQQANGFFGPKSNKDWWPHMLMLQALQLHYEATHDKRVIPFMSKFFAYQMAALDKQPLKGWASARGGENLLSIHWLYNQTGDTSLLSLATKINKQTVDWTNVFEEDSPVHTNSTIDTTKWWEDSPQHTVNLSHGLKQPALLFQQTGNKRYWDAVYKSLSLTDRYHNQLFGVHAGDERVGLATSNRSSELCEIVEYMHSLEQMMRIFQDPVMADRLEKVAYNALPAAISPDWKSHSYYISPNVATISRGKRNFTVDHGDDLTFGVLSGFPCCAANMHMAWPMLTEHLWMATTSKGLAAMVYAPSQVQAKVGNGTNISIRQETDYPFSNKILLHLNPAKKVSFPLGLRIPQWCNNPQILLNGDTLAQPQPGKFVTLEREWNKGDKVELIFPMAMRMSRWENNSIGIERGPLVYALAIKEKWQATSDWHRNNIPDEFPAYEISPVSPWNYGLVVDTLQIEKTLSVSTQSPVAQQPWSAENVPVYITATGKIIPQWKLNTFQHPAPLPVSPVESASKEETIKLIPFGATRLRMTYLPIVK
ncbi:glycoside hydrolase family 127 protein [Rhodocytophaga aerolata]|uniref:Glycoside hydrolase family 127 protein n=2 Tax=Rhodocytophaga aerolata TaxID=455078 RepID=A0ABT8R7R5_9BACT|nr:beta-L-arabinofuranosidase domain-containing protein [Rhodocytophaga aerolata]MDO1448145.1 glycoside hydrolase family 127 protein [Rhodocytophaga aerolata]